MVDLPPGGMDYDEFLAALEAEGRTEDDAVAEGQRLFRTGAIHISLAGWRAYPRPDTEGGEHDGRVCTASVRDSPYMHAHECPRRNAEGVTDRE